MSDDEYCDLETLEALLETDNLDDEAPILNDKKQDHNDFSQEMEEFLKAVSDESDDDSEKLPHKGKSFDGSTSKGKSEGIGNRSLSQGSPKNNLANKVVDSPEISRGVRETSTKCSERMGLNLDESQNATTLALQQELLKMQKKMEEMQKLLMVQQNKNVKAEAQVKSQPISAHTMNSPSIPESPSLKKVSQGRKIHLITDDEENPFIDKNKSSTLKNVTPGNIKSFDQSDKNKREVKKADNKATTSKQLFGDSDSDWDGLDGEEKTALSEDGKKIKRLLQAGQRDRQAHKSGFMLSDRSAHHSWTKYSSPKSQNTNEKQSDFTPETRKDEKFSLKCKSSSRDQGKPQNETPQNDKFVTEDFSKIRIINPLVSSTTMKVRMEGRKLINISRIHSKINTPDLQSDWVTIGVIVGKSNAKSSNSGKPYSIWKLNDLQDLDNCVSFFLFGEVHKSHWKMDVGCVIGLLNPSMMESMERGKSEPAFTIKNPNQLMVLGQSKDLGWCLARTKKGNKCSHFVNKKQGDFCSYHVQAEYKKTSAKRLELQGSVTGIKPKSFEQKIFSKNCAYMYGGRAYLPNAASAKAKNSVTISKLQQNINNPQEVNTLSLHNIKVSKEAKASGKSKITEDKDHLFMNMLSVPSPGAMNLVAHMKSNVDEPGTSKVAATFEKQTNIISISATDLLKKHKLMMKNKQVEKRKASDLLLASAKTQHQKIPKIDPLKEVPVLGKGLNDGQDISLFTSPPSSKGFSPADKSKLKAISILQNKGGVSKEDPNAVRKRMEPKELNAIKKRLKDRDGAGSSSQRKAYSSGSSSTEDEPPKKRSRLLGDIDLNSSEVKAILKAKSLHKGALSEAEAEREETYFSELEKKEKMEEKMKSVTSIEINVFTCKQCQYTAQSALAQCKTDNHTIVRTKAKKRFFACKKCKERVSTISGQFPTDTCRKCGSLCFEKTSMYKEKAGPKLESEILSLRGDEVKFLNSLDHKVYLNTVIDK